MMGNRVFRHRVFYCNYECDDRLDHCHEGKLVGNRGVHYSTGLEFQSVQSASRSEHVRSVLST